MAMPKTDALQASWDISWQGIRRTVRTSQSHAPPEEQSWTKANRKHTRNSLTPRTPRICLGNERGLVRELDTTMNNGRQKKLCELSHYSCCMLLKVASWSLKAATCNVVMPSPFNMPRGTRRGAQNNTEHDTRIIWDELISQECRAACYVSADQDLSTAMMCSGNYLHACIAVLSKLTLTCQRSWKKLHPPASASKSAREAHSFRATAFKSANTARIPSI